MSHYPLKAALLELAADIQTDCIEVEMTYHDDTLKVFDSVRDDLHRLYKLVDAMDLLMRVDAGEDQFLKAVGEINAAN